MTELLKCIELVRETSELLQGASLPSPTTYATEDVMAKVVPEVAVRTEERPTTYAKNDPSTTYAKNEGLGEGLRREALSDWDARKDYLAKVCEGAGLEPVLDVRQIWRVHAHEVIVEFFLDQRCYHVLLVLEGWPTPPAPGSLALAEVFAVSVTGELRKLNGKEMARFKLRSLVEAGMIPPPAPAELLALPSDAPVHAIEVWPEVAKLVSIRRLNEARGEPMPLSAPWFSKWTGLPENTIRRAKRWFAKHGYIVKVEEEIDVGKAKPLYLYSIVGADGEPA